jgi:hypothetical protein
MSYKSLFQIAELTKELQVYHGSLECIFNDTIKILKKKKKSNKDYSVLVFHTQRIIRALVDCKEENPQDVKLLELLRNGIFTSLNMYRQYDNPDTLNDILGLREKIVKLDESILGKIVNQYTDNINLVASDPRFSEATAEKLYKMIGNEKAILFVVGHGGIGAGLDVILRFEELSGQRNLEFYPVRFSRSEYKGYMDTTPCLTTAEIDYLREEVVGKKVIVFDENHYTGTNVRTVTKFISEKLACEVEMIYNVNTGMPGEWVELFNKLQS